MRIMSHKYSRTALLTGAILFFGLAPAIADEDEAYDYATAGTRQSGDMDAGFGTRMLVEAENLGGTEVEIAEMTFPAGSRGRGHLHGAVEIFYVLEGTFTHVVNGRGARLTPGQVGIVRPGDTVEHIVEGDEPARVLVIWAPGGEVGRIFGSRQMEEIEPLELSDMPASD